LINGVFLFKLEESKKEEGEAAIHAD